MARKSVSKKKVTPAEKTDARVSRKQVITFRISDEEAAVIGKAADRVPLARYSRDAVLARAKADAKR